MSAYYLPGTVLDTKNGPTIKQRSHKNDELGDLSL